MIDSTYQWTAMINVSLIVWVHILNIKKTPIVAKNIGTSIVEKKYKASR